MTVIFLDPINTIFIYKDLIGRRSSVQSIGMPKLQPQIWQSQTCISIGYTSTNAILTKKTRYRVSGAWWRGPSSQRDRYLMRWCGAYASSFHKILIMSSRAATQSITVRHLSPLSWALFIFEGVKKKWAFFELPFYQKGN